MLFDRFAPRKLITLLSGPSDAWRSPANLLAISTIIFLTSLAVRSLYWQDNIAALSGGKRESALQMMSSLYRDQAKQMLAHGGVFFPGGSVDAGDSTILVHPPGYSM